MAACSSTALRSAIRQTNSDGVEVEHEVFRGGFGAQIPRTPKARYGNHLITTLLFTMQ